MSDVEKKENEQLYLNTFKKLTDDEFDNSFFGRIKRIIDSGAYTERYKRAREKKMRGKYRNDLLTENLNVMGKALTDVIERSQKLVFTNSTEELIKIDSKNEASQTGEELSSVIRRRKQSGQYEQEKQWADDILKLVMRINDGQSKDSHMKTFVLDKISEEIRKNQNIYRAVSKVHTKYNVPYSFIQNVMDIK